MSRLTRRLLISAVVVASVALPTALAGPAAAVRAGSTPAVAATSATASTTVGGLQLRYLPAGLGSATDFRYEFDDVSFVSRVWESPAPTAGWQVDLDVVVMRGARLTDAQSLHDWFIAYEQRPPAEARYHPFSVHGQPGWRCRDQIFWLVRPGVAVSVQLDRTRWSGHEVARIARSARGPVE